MHVLSKSCFERGVYRRVLLSRLLIRVHYHRRLFSFHTKCDEWNVLLARQKEGTKSHIIFTWDEATQILVQIVLTFTFVYVAYLAIMYIESETANPAQIIRIHTKGDKGAKNDKKSVVLAGAVTYNRLIPRKRN